MTNTRSLLLSLATCFLATFAFAQVSSEADLLVTKTAPAEAAAGSDVTYTVEVRNLGPDDAPTVTLTDPIPAGMTFVSATSEPAFVCTTPAIGDGGTISCVAATLIAGDTATFTFVVSIPLQTEPGTFFVNQASATTQAVDPNDENNTGIATTTTPPPPQADLAVVKSGPTATGPDTDITYTIVLSNGGPAAATNVTLTDPIPADLTFVSLTQTGTPLTCDPLTAGAGGTLSCSAPTYAAGGSTTLSLTLHVPAEPAGEYTNTATVQSDSDPNPENNATTTSLLVTAVDVSVTKTGPAIAAAGTTISYTITVANAGPDAAADVTLVDPLPAGTTFVSMTHVGGPVAACTTNGTVTCAFGPLAAGASSQYTLTLAITTATTISNTATVSTSSFDTDPADNTATAVTTVTQSADLAVVKNAAASVLAGTNLTFSVTATNAGPSNATAVSISDTLPAGTTFVSATQTSGPAFTCGHAAGTITCTAATFDAGATATFDFVVTVLPGTSGLLTNTVAIAASTPDPSAANNSSTSITTVSSSADLAVIKTAPPAAAVLTDVTFSVTLTNLGPSTASNVVLADAVPANTTFVSATQTSGPLFACSLAAGTITCSIASFDPGAAATFSFVVTPTAEGSLTNTATVTSTTADPVSPNNASTTTTTVARAVADVGIVKTANADEAVPGAPATFTIVVTNSGPGPAANVVVTDPLPAGVTLVGATATQGSCSGTTTVTCNLGTLEAAASATITLEVLLPLTPGPVANTATVTSSDVDPNGGNNAGAATITVAQAPAAIPTLSPWMLALLAAALTAVVLMRSR